MKFSSSNAQQQHCCKSLYPSCIHHSPLRLKLFRAVAGKQVVDNCLTGYNSCIFAYGQTGSGKTHTMLGHMQEAVGGGIGSTEHVVCYLELCSDCCCLLHLPAAWTRARTRPCLRQMALPKLHAEHVLSLIATMPAAASSCSIWCCLYRAC